MTLGTAMPKPRRPALLNEEPIEPARERDRMMAAIAMPVLDEVAAFGEAFLPAGEREDFELATALYVETHPVMRERLYDVLAHTVADSGAIAIDEPRLPLSRKGE